MRESKQIAIVYDWFDKWGGVERILLAVHNHFPNATFFTSHIDYRRAGWAKDFKVNPSFMQRLPHVVKQNRILSLPFYPYAFESFRFQEYDVVFSITSSFAKGVITQPGVRHVCYLLTPTRFLWTSKKEYQSNVSRVMGKGFIRYLTEWDSIASSRPDTIISISQTVADRCLSYYHRASDVLYPPFDPLYWTSLQQEKPAVSSPYFLLVSRLEPYKHVELAIQVFNKRPHEKLVVVGVGKERRRLRKMAGDSIVFLDSVTDRTLATLYRNAVGLIMPQEEDFGYVSLEAQALGCPVIAYEKGGAKETVTDGKTGILFHTQSQDGLMSALERFHTISYNLKEQTRKNGPSGIARFSSERFVNGLDRVLFKN